EEVGLVAVGMGHSDTPVFEKTGQAPDHRGVVARHIEHFSLDVVPPQRVVEDPFRKQHDARAIAATAPELARQRQDQALDSTEQIARRTNRDVHRRSEAGSQETARISAPAWRTTRRRVLRMASLTAFATASAPPGVGWKPSWNVARL